MERARVEGIFRIQYLIIKRYVLFLLEVHVQFQEWMQVLMRRIAVL